LWMTPLIADAGGTPMATAQGALIVDDAPVGIRRRYTIIEGSGRIASGGVLENDLPRPRVAAAPKLLLREPDIGTAARIAAVVDSVIGKGTATVEDPGSVALTLKDGEASAQLAVIGALRVEPTRTGRIVIDTRQGTVVAGGDLILGPAVVSVAGMTLTIGRVSADSTRDDRGAVRLAAGATVQDLAAALQSLRTPPAQVAQILEALRQAGAISAEIVTR
ncbi:MAG: flagellar basal body P-ring protein FlgI, partial [Gemmatimonadaceae bacterium]